MGECHNTSTRVGIARKVETGLSVTAQSPRVRGDSSYQLLNEFIPGETSPYAWGLLDLEMQVWARRFILPTPVGISRTGR